ncbi:hypothetical protein CEQ90_20160 [Lewinellaceae bacterium SD302]|nr:hypothetical protein CEQ90_20160 [Lewinellaceae bacterium SD302]
MKKIRENINSIIKYQKELGYHMPNVLNPPANDKKIEQTEITLGLSFNKELVELFKTVNGIRQDGKTACGLTGIIPIHDLLDLDAAANYSNYMDWDEHIDIYELTYDFGHKMFPFIHDGAGNCYWVDLNEGTKNYGKLYWTNTFGDQPSYLFNSLTDFFEAIKIGYQQEIFILDEDGYLDCNYKKWGEICHSLDQSISYWKQYID